MDVTKQEAAGKRNTILADLGILFVALFWGGGFVAGKFALTAMPPMTLMAYRYVGAAVIVFVFSLKKLKQLKDKKLLLSAVICGLLMFGGNSLQTIGLQYTTAGKQSFITSLYILLVPLISWAVFKTRPARNILVAAVLGFAGIALITLTDQLTIGKGDLMTFGLALSFSAQMIFTSRVVKNVDAMLLTLIQLIVTGSLSAAAALIFEDPVTPAAILSLPAAGLAGLVYLMTFNSAFAFLLQNICLRFAPVTHAAIILSLETVFGTIFAVVIAGEVFSGRMIVGCALMFLAIGITEFSTYASAGRKQESPAPKGSCQEPVPATAPADIATKEKS